MTYVQARPGLDNFLNCMVNYYEIILWTDLPRNVADPIIDKIDPSNIYFSDRLFYKHCKKSKNGDFWIKDLSKVGRDEKMTILVSDKAPEACSLQKCQGLPILPWKGDGNDIEL